MLFAIIVLGVAGVLILALVHPPDRDRAKWVKLAGGVFDAADGDVDAAVAAVLRA